MSRRLAQPVMDRRDGDPVGAEHGRGDAFDLMPGPRLRPRNPRLSRAAGLDDGEGTRVRLEPLAGGIGVELGDVDLTPATGRRRAGLVPGAFQEHLLVRHGITVNVIAPAIWTPMYDACRVRLSADELAAHDRASAAKTPIGGRLGDPDRDLAPVIVFLVGDGARFLTGQTLAIDGGRLMVR